MLCQKETQLKEFNTSFYIEDILDYIPGWKLLTIKIYKEDYKIAIPSPKDSILSGSIIHVPDKYLKKIDKYEGKHYKRIKVTTISDTDCFLYVKNDNKI